MIRAVLFDFGGVILTSPFDAFATYEQKNRLPTDLIRTINSTNADTNAWALFERGTLNPAGFAKKFESEGLALGYRIDGLEILSLIEGELRPEMVEAVRRVNTAGLATACLTNNFRSWESASDEIQKVMKLFDEVVESSQIGVRKPDPSFYEIALDRLGVEASKAVFLDDLGINLKPARAMGMTTIKVFSASQALTDLEKCLGIPLR